MSGVLQLVLMVRTLDYRLQCWRSRVRTLLLCFFFDYIIEDKVFENFTESQCYRILMVHVLSILHRRTNSGQISRPAAGRIDTA